MKQERIAVVWLALLCLTGCDSGKEDAISKLDRSGTVAYRVTVDYAFAATVVKTPYTPPGAPIEEAEARETIAARIDAEGPMDDSGFLGAQSVNVPSWTAGTEIQLSPDRKKIVSLKSERTKKTGMQHEWVRDDRVEAAGMPRVESDSTKDAWVYRLEGPAACAAIKALDYEYTRDSTKAMPGDGPSNAIKSGSAPIPGPDAHITVTIKKVTF